MTRNGSTQRLFRALGPVLVVACVLAAVAVTPGAAGARGRAPVEVAADGGPLPFTWTWAPDEIDVPVGGAVRWTNDTNSEHAVASGEGPWDTTVHLPIGGTAVLRFKKPGVYTYRCPLLGHSDVVHLGGGPDEGLCVGMCGVITVGG